MYKKNTNNGGENRPFCDNNVLHRAYGIMANFTEDCFYFVSCKCILKYAEA